MSRSSTLIYQTLDINHLIRNGYDYLCILGLVIGLALLALYLLGVKRDGWKAAAITSLVIMVIGWAAYFFHFQQLFVKRWGGVMTVTVPEGQLHMGATWKDDNLWIENYDPKTNTCHFREFSKGALLEGKVVIKDCNPLMPNRVLPLQ